MVTGRESKGGALRGWAWRGAGPPGGAGLRGYWAGPRRREEGKRAAREKIEEQAGLDQKKEEGDRESSFFHFPFYFSHF